MATVTLFFVEMPKTNRLTPVASVVGLFFNDSVFRTLSAVQQDPDNKKALANTEINWEKTE